MNKTCARCEKTVYPTEELKCLDKILVALAFYACGSYQTLVGQSSSHLLSQSSVSRAIRQVTEVLNLPQIFHKYIKFPGTQEDREEIKRGFYQKFGISGALGCIDGTHVAIVTPADHEERYFNRKGYHSLNVLVMCDSDARIMCVDSSYPGSTHDSAAWNNNPLSNTLNDIVRRTNEDFYLLGDAGFPLRRTMMTPILNAEENTPEALYTEMHMTTRNVVERCRHRHFKSTFQVWHKGCFKCQECGMTLNMRTYKGYGKLPYCESHVPKAKHTTMAETPELKRIAENTKIQSNVKYHADFEKSKGKFTQVADDPETLRIKANTKIISNVAYHGELEKKAQMEKQRQINENGEIVELPSDNYHQQIDNYATEMLAPNVPPPNLPPKNHYQTPSTQYHPPPPQQQPVVHQQQQSVVHQPQQPAHQPSGHNRQYQEQYYKPKEEYYPQYQEYQGQYYPQYQNYPAPPQNQSQQSLQQKIGRIQDYDPISDGPRAPPNTQRASATLIYNSTSDGKRGSHQQPVHQQQQSRQIGRVTDLDPLANELPRQTVNHHNPNQRVYVAMYDYEASDSDEVSFREGDLISNVTSIDSGWMTGQVLRTGRTGMLPANYVELTQSNSVPHYDN